jgi:HAD superfamily hydrolase (TIGR01509 family)
MSRFDLIIFDCDGVVVDSEPIVHEVFGDFVRSLGMNMTTEEMFERFLGKTLADCVAVIEQATGRPLPRGALDRYKQERDRALRERVTPISGVRAVLESLTTPYCIASNGDFEKMSATLGATGLLALFEGRVFSALDVARGKPAPDLFLHAAARMGVEPGRAAVVEDSLNGVLAGRAAGMTTYGFSGLISRERLLAAGAHVTFSRMADLPALLA